jgi:hypothetical protein
MRCLLSHASPRRPARPHAIKEPRSNNETGSHKESDPPGTSSETDRPDIPDNK